MTTKPPFQATIRNDAELSALWAKLMGPGGFGKRSLWLTFLDERDRTLPVIMPIDGIAAEPDPRLIRNIAEVVEGVLSDGEAASVALLLSRPGAPGMSASDRRWARALRAELGPALCRWPIHLATYERIQVFAPDDLIAAS